MLYFKALTETTWIFKRMKVGSHKDRGRQQYLTESVRSSSTSPSNILGYMLKPFSLLFSSGGDNSERYASPRKNKTPDYSAVQKEYASVQKQKQMMNNSSLAAGKSRSSSSSHLQHAGLSYIYDSTAKNNSNNNTTTASVSTDKNTSLIIPKPARKSGTTGSSSLVSPTTSNNYEYLENGSKTRTPNSSTTSNTIDTFSMVNPALNSARRSLTNNNASVAPSLLSTITPSSSSAATSAVTSATSTVDNSPSTSTTTSSKPKVLCCDKCDGKHETENCPYYKKKREDHPDAQKNRQIGGTSSLPGNILRNARVVRQPGDGSCLFHSMSYGLRGGNASTLRSEICNFIRSNPNFLISDTPLKDWVKWDSGCSVEEYARTMSRGSWGGGIEMACTMALKGVNVHVYERSNSGGFKRISAFDHPDNPAGRPVIRVLYCGGVHYDALVLQ